MSYTYINIHFIYIYIHLYKTSMHVLISSKFPTDEKIYGWWYGEVVKYLLSKPYNVTSIPRAHTKAEMKERNEPTKSSDAHMNVVWLSQAYINHTHNING